MKSKDYIFIVVPIALLIGFVTGFFYGRATHQEYKPVEEFRTAHILLTDGSDLNPQLREYLKLRVYWNAAVMIRSEWLEGYKFDFGPVDESILGDAGKIKGPSKIEEFYPAAMEKHGQKKAGVE